LGAKPKKNYNLLKLFGKAMFTTLIV